MGECTCHDVLIVKDLNRWFKEKWVDVSRKDKDGKHPPCGRSKAKKGSKGYPKCRPSVKVSSKTPKTSGSMSEGEKRAATKRKRSKKQGVGGKPTIVKSSMDIAWRLLKEESREQLSNEELFLDFLGEKDLMHYDEMNDKQRAIIDAQAALPSHLFTEGTEMGENMNRYLFSRSMHEKIPDYHYDDELEYLQHYNDALQPFLNNREKTQEVDGDGLQNHPEHPHNVAMSRMHPSFKDRLNLMSKLYSPNFQASEPMDLAWRLLKEPVSPEAKRHKLEYDKKYESTPERVKYREELNRERRKRGIYGHGGPDMSHTKDHTLVAESPHANRARHFKERGTLKG